MVKRHNTLTLGLLRLADLVVAIAAWISAYGLHELLGQWGWINPPQHTLRELAPWMALSLLLVVLTFSRMGMYEPKRTRHPLSDAAGAARAVVLVWLLTYLFVDYVSPARSSRATMGLLLVTWLALAAANHLVTRMMLQALRRRGWNLRHAAIVGTGRLGQRLYHVLQTNTWTGIEPTYFIGGVQDRRELLGLDVVGPVDEVDAIVEDRPVDIVFVALSAGHADAAEHVLSRLALTHVDVRVVPDLLSSQFLRHDVTQLEDLSIITLTHSPQHGWNSVIKRLMDVAGALVALAVLAAPMLVIAALVRLSSPGPILYRQKRTSLGGKPFTIFKFRTMVNDAEAKTGPVWATDEDARVTRVGRVLRNTSLDELPQFINVLLGDMSIVGPRPERPELVERFRQHIPRYMMRSQVKAGLTGWAQVNGLRGNTSLRKRIQYDLHYITHWSLSLDLWILLLSFWRGFSARPAKRFRILPKRPRQQVGAGATVDEKGF